MGHTGVKYFSMFTGIGGFELGIQRAALSVRNGQTENTSTSPFEQSVESTTESLRPDGNIADHISTGDSREVSCVGYSEIDKYAIQTYEHNFGKEVPNFGNATTINTADLPDFDLLVGGFPCQAFSVAGKRAGFNDTRGTLIFDVVRILRDKRPRHFVLENVKGLLSHESGKTFSHILEILTDTGYDVSWSIHNSKNYGVPQNRERVYIIGNLRGEPRPQVFPLRGEGQAPINQLGNIDQHKRERGNPQTGRVYSPQGVSPTLSTMQGGGLEPKVVVPVLTPDRPVKRQNGRRFKEDGDPSFTLTSQYKHGVMIAKTIRVGGGGSPHGSKQNGDSYEVDGRIRRLTPLECERLQGFPDGWTLGSDTQRYKQCGNAITVNVVEHVIGEIYAKTNND